MKSIRSFLFGVLVLVAVMSLQPANAGQSSAKIVAVVNDGAITTEDLDIRMDLIIISSGMQNTKETKDRLRPQILSLLIDEELRFQEADRIGIKAAPEDIESGIASIASQNNFTVPQFKEIMAKQGVSIRTLERQIKSQFLWSRIVKKTIAPDVVITDKEVDAQIDRMRANIGKTEFLVSEIFLPVETPSEEASVRKLADKLTQQLLGGHVPFVRVASQFSKSSSAARGGDLGWIQDGQLQDEINKQLSKMGEEDLSRPVRTLAGYHILHLRKKRDISEATIPDRETVRSTIGLERLERLQRGRMLDLKATAFIERRV